MTKRLLIFNLFFLLFIISIANAQYTSVSATVTDSGGQAWVSGSWTATLKVPFTPSGGPLLNGTPIDCKGGDPCLQYTGVLDGTGSLAASLPDNTKITPSGSKWTFTICPNASSNCVSTTLIISGATQSITSQLSAVASAPQVTPQPAVARSYRDAEIFPIAPGQIWLDVTLGVLKYVKQDNTIATVGSGGGGTPGGSDQQIQYNCSGAFCGNTAWTFNYGVTPPTKTFKGLDYTDAINDTIFLVSDFNWTQSPSGTLTVGSNTVNLTPCPKGVAGANVLHYVWISGSGGTEAAKITGGTCTSGAGTGTIIFTTVNNYNAGYTISSASGGLKEASEFAKYVVTNPTGSSQSGRVVIQAKQAISILATTYITASDQTLDLAGSVLECSVANNGTCLFIGDNINANDYENIRVNGPRGRAMVASTGAFIEDNANVTTIRNLSMRNAFSGGYFGTLVQVDNDQAFTLDGVDSVLGSWSRCDSTFCSVAITGVGPFSTNAAVMWLSHLNLSLSCLANGVLANNGNTIHITDSVIQAYPQYGISTGGLKGGFGQTQIDNVYEEVGNCHNPVGYDATNFPLGLGQMGIIDYAQPITWRGGEGPAGQVPTFNSAGSGGANKLYYFLVGHSTTLGTTSPILIGTATPTNGTNVLGEFPALCQLGGCGTVTYDILMVQNMGTVSPSDIGAPNGTGNYAVPGAQALTSAACSNNVCSFTDTRASLTSYTTLANPSNSFWYPVFSFLGGGAIFSVSADKNITSGSTNPSTFKFIGPTNAQVIPTPLHSSLGVTEPTFSFTDCPSIGLGVSNANSPYLYQCPVGTIMPLGNNTPPQGASLIYAGNLTGGSSVIVNRKGSIIFENSVVNGPTALITFHDSDFGNKIATSPTGRPVWDTNDVDMGVDTNNTNLAVGLYLRSSSSISEYIGINPDGSSWKRRVTSTGETLKVPLTISSASNQLVITSTNSYTFNFANPGANRIISVNDPTAAAILPLITGSITNGDCLKFSGTTGTIVDTGAGCGGLSGLTTNVLLKAASATTATNSSITDNGSTVSTTEPISVAQQAAGLNYIGSWNDTTCQWNQGANSFFQIQMVNGAVTLNVNNGGCNTIATTASQFPLSQILGGIAPSGQTYDFSQVTQIKLRAGAGLTTSANGDAGFDTTNLMWHFYSGAADAIIPVMLTTTASGVTNGQCAIYSVSGNTVQLGAQTCVSGGTVSANSGSVGAIGRYAAAGGSTTISPDTLLTDNGTTLTYTGTGGLILPNGLNTGTYTLTFANSSTFGFYSKTASQIVLGNGGTDQISFLNNGSIEVPSTGCYKISTNSQSSGGAVTSFCGNGSGIATIGNGTANSLGTLQLAKLSGNQLTSNSATAPTCAFTSGGGTTPSCALDTGSSDAGGSFTATTGTGSPGSSGSFTLTFAAAYGANAGKCVYTLSDASAGQWNARATAIAGAQSTASSVANWDNNAVTLSTSTAYKVNYHCYGN